MLGTRSSPSDCQVGTRSQAQEGLHMPGLRVHAIYVCMCVYTVGRVASDLRSMFAGVQLSGLHRACDSQLHRSHPSKPSLHHCTAACREGHCMLLPRSAVSP